MRELERARLQEQNQHQTPPRQYTHAMAPSMPDGVVNHPTQALDLERCRSGGKWPRLEKFDLVISWWTNRNQSNFKHWSSHGASLLETGVKSGVLAQRIENQAEA